MGFRQRADGPIITALSGKSSHYLMLLWPVNLVRHFLSPVGWTPYVVNTAVLRTQTSFQSSGGKNTGHEGKAGEYPPQIFECTATRAICFFWLTGKAQNRISRSLIKIEGNLSEVVAMW